MICLPLRRLDVLFGVSRVMTLERVFGTSLAGEHRALSPFGHLEERIHPIADFLSAAINVSIMRQTYGISLYSRWYCWLLLFSPPERANRALPGRRDEWQGWVARLEVGVEGWRYLLAVLRPLVELVVL